MAIAEKQKREENGQRSPLQVAMLTSRHAIWCRLRAASVEQSPVLAPRWGWQGTRYPEFLALFRFGCPRQCSDRTRATSRTFAEALISASPNRVLRRRSCPINGAHFTIVTMETLTPRYVNYAASAIRYQVLRRKDRKKKSALIPENTPRQRRFLVSGVAFE